MKYFGFLQETLGFEDAEILKDCGTFKVGLLYVVILGSW